MQLQVPEEEEEEEEGGKCLRWGRGGNIEDEEESKEFAASIGVCSQSLCVYIYIWQLFSLIS